MKIPNPDSAKISVARCGSLSSNDHFHLPADQYECRICPFRVSGNGGFQVIATATITSPTAQTGEFIEVICEDNAGNWYRLYRYRRRGTSANINVIMFTDGTGRPMVPGTYSVYFRLNRPESGVTIRVSGRIVRLRNRP